MISVVIAEVTVVSVLIAEVTVVSVVIAEVTVRFDVDFSLPEMQQ